MQAGRYPTPWQVCVWGMPHVLSLNKTRNQPTNCCCISVKLNYCLHARNYVLRAHPSAGTAAPLLRSPATLLPTTVQPFAKLLHDNKKGQAKGNCGVFCKSRRCAGPSSLSTSLPSLPQLFTLWKFDFKMLLQQ